MARPRLPEDPRLWPVQCGRCGGHYELVASWPDARVCLYCYQAAKRTTGACGCGHRGVLPGRVGDRPACRACTGIRLNVDCAGCGAETELPRVFRTGNLRLIHAASCPFRYSSRTSCGVRYPSVE